MPSKFVKAAVAAFCVLLAIALADRMKQTCKLPAGPLAAGQTLSVTLSNGVALGNKGGSITLLDHAGLKMAGVAYTAEQAREEGWTITF